MGFQLRTRLGPSLCLSQPGSAFLLLESPACTAGQGLCARFNSLHQAHRVSSPSRGLAPQDKAFVHALPLSSKLIVYPRRVAGSHHRTKVGSTACVSPPGLAYLLGESRARTAGHLLIPRFVSLRQAQRVSLPKRELLTQDKASVHALPFSIRLSLYPRRVAGLHRTTRLGSRFCLSPLGSACVLAKLRACTVQQGFGPCFFSLH